MNAIKLFFFRASPSLRREGSFELNKPPGSALSYGLMHTDTHGDVSVMHSVAAEYV